MIIEIKGLPEGQKIRHLTVDIDFDGSGEIESMKVNPLTDGSFNANVKEQVETISNREQKEIPPEMKDVEF